MKDLNAHWNKIFSKTEDDKLGWFENDFSQMIKFLEMIPQWQESKIFVPGVGTSGLIEILSNSNAKLILNDLSSQAIELAKSKYGTKNKKWLCQDISKPLPEDIKGIDIWLDRAVLHFLTEDKDIEQYFKNVVKAVKPGGHAIFAEFSKTGAKKCAGLNLKRYDEYELFDRLPNFGFIKCEEYTFINPKGDPRPYIYSLFRKK